MRWQLHAQSRVLVLQALCIFSGIFFGVQICSCNITCSYNTYHRTDNTRLTVSYASVWKITAIACCNRCHSDSSCKSVTYNLGSQECRLSSVSFTNVLSNSKSSDEWATYSEFDPCPEPWILYREHCYRLVTLPQTWKQSENYCKMMGAYLTDVLDDFENTFVYQIGVDGGGINEIWLGLGNYHTIKPHFWTSGQQVNYTYFNPSEPNNFEGKEECIMIVIHDSKWNDLECSYRLSSVCKKRRC